MNRRKLRETAILANREPFRSQKVPIRDAHPTVVIPSAEARGICFFLLLRVPHPSVSRVRILPMCNPARLTPQPSWS